MDDNDNWFSTADYNPGVLFMVRFADGNETNARWVCGSWEDLDGRAVYPVAFWLNHAEVHAITFNGPKSKTPDREID